MSDDGITRLNTRLTADHAALMGEVAATDGEPFAVLDLGDASATAASRPPGNGLHPALRVVRHTMLEIAAAQIRYALESDEPSPAMRTTLTTAQNALDRVCRNCAGERWEDAEDGGRCINCGTPHHGLR